MIYLLGGRLQHALPQGVHGVSIISEIELLSHPALSPNDEQVMRGLLNEVVRYPLTDEIRDRTVLQGRLTDSKRAGRMRMMRTQSVL